MRAQKKGVTSLIRSKKALLQIALLIGAAAMIGFGALRGEADIDQFAYGESGPLPEALILANRNYMNLLELPMLFYVVCVLTYITSVQSTWLVTLAWAYVVLRVLHSFVHLTYNHVLHRFALFATSNVILTLQWLLLGTALISHT